MANEATGPLQACPLTPSEPVSSLPSLLGWTSSLNGRVKNMAFSKDADPACGNHPPRGGHLRAGRTRRGAAGGTLPGWAGRSQGASSRNVGSSPAAPECPWLQCECGPARAHHRAYALAHGRKDGAPKGAQDSNITPSNSVVTTSRLVVRTSGNPTKSTCGCHRAPASPCFTCICASHLTS